MKNPAILKYKDLLKVKYSGKKPVVYDIVRKKYVTLTPEEFVRQLFIHFLIEEIKIPVKHIAIERQITFQDMVYRFDILVFDKKAAPWMIVECKSYNVPLSNTTAFQISKYNMQLKAPLLCITNGKESKFFRIDGNTPVPLPYPAGIIPSKHIR